MFLSALFKRKQILIVDDSVSLRMALRDALSDAGYDVIEACDGQDALTKLDGRRYHLVISDVNMPHMDGYAFLRTLRMLPAYKYTPVVVLTTVEPDPANLRARQAGAKAWLAKPFQAQQLLSVVAKLVSRIRGGRLLLSYPALS